MNFQLISSGARTFGHDRSLIFMICLATLTTTAVAPYVAFAQSPDVSESNVCTLDIVLDTGFDYATSLDLGSPGPFTVAQVSSSGTQNGRVTPWVANYPTGASAAPIVLFVPGFSLPSSLYQAWTAHLASWGYVAVRADPPSSFSSVDEPAMVLDLRNVVTQITSPGTLPISVDAARIAMSGHSLGGKLALSVAAADARVKAVFVFDPVNGAGPSGYSPTRPNIVPQPVASITVPIGILGELLDSAGASMACAPASMNYQTIYSAAMGAPLVYEWTLAGASHTSFVPDQASCGVSCSFCQPATLAAAETFTFMRSSAVAFLRTHLTDNPRSCPWLTGGKVPSFVTIRERALP